MNQKVDKNNLNNDTPLAVIYTLRLYIYIYMCVCVCMCVCVFCSILSVDELKVCFRTQSRAFLARISLSGSVKWIAKEDPADADPFALPSASNKEICSYSALGDQFN